MFFDLVLLRRQHKGRLNFAWLAGTRGIQHVSKKDVLELDISELCDDISEHLCSTSDSPRYRFSLRLSAVLINGTLKIHRQKAIYFFEELAKFLQGISRPAIITMPSTELERTGFIESPPTPIPRKKGKKKIPSIPKSTPESQLERLIEDIRVLESGRIEALKLPEAPAVLQARADEVTLRESHPLREEEVEEFGVLGVLPTEEELRREIAGIEKEVAVPPTTLPPLLEEPEVPVPEIPSELPPERRERRRVVSSTSSESEPEAVRVFAVQAQVHASAGVSPESPVTREPVPIQPVETEQLPVQEEEIRIAQIEEPREVPVEVEARVPARRVLAETTLAAVEKRDKAIKKVRERKRDKDFDKLLLSTKPTKVARINRCENGEVEWVDIHPYPLPQFKLKMPSLTNLLNMYVVRDDRDLQRRKKVSEISSLEESLTLQRKEGRVTPPAKISLEARPTPSILVERVEKETPVPQIQVTAEAVELPVEVPRSPIVPIETPLPEIEMQVEELQVTRPPLITSTPAKRKTPEIESRTIEEVMAVAAEEEAVSRRKRRRLLDVEPELSKDLDFITLPPSELLSRDLTSLAAEPVSLAEKTVEPVPLPVVTEQGRQQEIVNNIFISGRLTLEQICQKPINKLNIARAFNDVLLLSKYNYVTLVSKENSSELEYIERGPKMAG